jgi:hypothetical protein
VQGRSGRAAMRAGGVVLVFAAVAAGAAGPGPADAGGTFAGAWSASGRRQTLAIEGGGAAAVVELSGAVVLTGGEGLGRGFRGEAIGFDDGQGLSVGRCVWTDERGDRLFSRLSGEPLQAGKRFTGTITGGTGRYAGLRGEYSFTWQYVIPAEDGRIQGRAVGLTGRVSQAETPR